MQISKYILIALAVCGIAACARQHHKNYYENSQTIQRIEIPAGLSASGIKDKYPAPPGSAVKPAPVDLLPPGTQS